MGPSALPVAAQLPGARINREKDHFFEQRQHGSASWIFITRCMRLMSKTCFARWLGEHTMKVCPAICAARAPSRSDRRPGAGDVVDGGAVDRHLGVRAHGGDQRSFEEIGGQAVNTSLDPDDVPAVAVRSR